MTKEDKKECGLPREREMRPYCVSCVGREVIDLIMPLRKKLNDAGGIGAVLRKMLKRLMASLN